MTTPCTIGAILKGGDALVRPPAVIVTQGVEACEGSFGPLRVVPNAEEAVRARFPRGAFRAGSALPWVPFTGEHMDKTLMGGVNYLSPEAILAAITVGEPCEDCDGAGTLVVVGMVAAGDEVSCPACNASGWTVNVCSGHGAMLEPSAVIHDDNTFDPVKPRLSLTELLRDDTRLTAALEAARSFGFEVPA